MIKRQGEINTLLDLSSFWNKYEIERTILVPNEKIKKNLLGSVIGVPRVVATKKIENYDLRYYD